MPEALQNVLRKLWHPLLSTMFAVAAGMPARSLTVVGINGTKGKSTTAEMLFAILRKAGHTTALASTIRFAVGETSEANLFKMTMPGRGYVQRFLARALKKGATHAVVELTTEGAREWRHRFLSLNGLIMLNVQKEHIERFGSFEKYVRAKWWLVKELERSKKPNRTIVVHNEGENAAFSNACVENKIDFSKENFEKIVHSESGVVFVYKGVEFTVHLPGEFNALNALAAIKVAEQLGVSLEIAAQALDELKRVPGRLEQIDEGQLFKVIVDYAHTPDSLEALYSAFPKSKKVCVLGNTGGGRDKWKRPEMGALADALCETVILTDEDPYDENPEEIVSDMAKGMKRKPTIIMDRREAIHKALTIAGEGDVVLISGKGTDPYIMKAKGQKIPWSDAQVVKEELARILEKAV